MAVGTSLGLFQKQLYTLLANDVILLNQVTGIFDETPEDEPFPYIVIGDAQETPFDTYPKMGRIAAITITVWSQHTGFLEVLSISDRIITLLNRYSFSSILPYISIYTMYKSGITKRDSDGITREAELHFDWFGEEV